MKNLSEGPVFRQLITFSIPLIVGNLFQALYSIIDGIFVGRMMGHQALAAVSISTPLIFFLVAILIGLGIAAVVLVGQAYGARDSELLSRILVNSFGLNVSVATVIMLAIMVGGRQMLTLINTPPELMDDAYAFLTWFAAGFLFMVINNWFMGVLRGLGDARTPLALTILSVALNILLLPLLIGGAGPVPALGVRGSALATVLANALTMVAGYCYLARTNHLLSVGTWTWAFDAAIIRKIVALGLPTSLQMLIVSFSGIVLMGLVNLFGEDVIAAYGIGLRMENFSILPAMSIGVAVSTMVAQSIGAGNRHRVDEITASAGRFTLAISLVVVLLCMLVPREIARIFTGDAAVLDHAAAYFRIMCWAYLNLSLFFIVQSAVRGAGAMTMPLIFSVISMTVRIGLSWALARHTPLAERGIWTGIFLSTIVGLVLMFAYYRRGSWRSKSILRAAEARGIVPQEGTP